jgi:hypothetical protein
VWVTELTDAFWRQGGDPGPFPRDLRRPLLRAGVVAIVERPGLSLSAVLDWLARHDFPGAEAPGPDRPLRAALAAAGEAGFVFLNGDDPDDERRLSLAHEIAHFLRDYWAPRRRAERLVGAAVLGVLDGRRPPRYEERLRSILAGVPIGYHTHFLAREPDGRAAGAAAEAERDADRLAYELLAPAEAALAEAPGTAGALARRLEGVFGLPRGHARLYARLLLPAEPLTERWLVHLLAE